jgi:hypothetical protein
MTACQNRRDGRSTYICPVAWDFRPVDLSFFETAPYRFVATEVLCLPARQVFAAIAHDPAGWGSWFPGFSHQGRYLTALPHGIRSQREVTAFGFSFTETVIAWNEDNGSGQPWRFAFYVEKATLPIADALAEDYRVVDRGDHAVAQWTFAFEPRPPLRSLAQLGRVAIPLIWRRATANLERRLQPAPKRGYQ